MTTPILLPSVRCYSVPTHSVTHQAPSGIFLSLICLAENLRQFSRALLRTVTLLVLLASGLPLYAQSFDELEEVLKNHPQLQTMRYQAAANRELADAAMGLPDPVISLGVNNFPIFDPSFSQFLPTNKAIGLQQRFPSRVARQARSAMGQAEALEFDEKHKQLYAAMRAELIALLHNQVRIKSQRSLAEQRDAKYDQLMDAVESAVQGGRSSVFRLAEIEAERAEVARTLVDLDAQTTQLNARFIYLLGSIPVSSPPNNTPDVWSGNSMDFHASRVADASVQVSNSGVDEAKSAWKPEWGAQLIYQQREAGNNFAGDDWVSMMVTVTVPFWAKAKQAPRLRAAQASRAAALASLNDVMRQAAAQYSYSSAVYTAANQAKLILQQKISAISDEITNQQANYASGAGDYSPIIDGEIAILTLRAEIVDEETRSAIAAAQMNALLVTP